MTIVYRRFQSKVLPDYERVIYKNDNLKYLNKNDNLKYLKTLMGF